MQLIFQTQRLLVREYEPKDADDFIALNGNEMVMRYIRPPVNRQEALNLFEANLKFTGKRGMGRWGVYEKHPGYLLARLSSFQYQAMIQKFR